MKAFHILIYIFSLSFLSLITSCKSDKLDTEKPGIVIYEPLAGDTIDVSTDSVHVEFHVTDNVELHEVLAKITDNSNTILWQSGEDVDKKEFQFHDHYIPTGTTALTPLKLTVTASDHSDNIDEKTVSFYIKP